MLLHRRTHLIGENFFSRFSGDEENILRVYMATTHKDRFIHMDFERTQEKISMIYDVKNIRVHFRALSAWNFKKFFNLICWKSVEKNWDGRNLERCALKGQSEFIGMLDLERFQDLRFFCVRDKVKMKYFSSFKNASSLV